MELKFIGVNIKLLSFFLIGVILSACNGSNSKNSNIVKLSGNTQGTTYHISYVPVDKNDYSQSIDSVLNAIDNSLSTYIENSTISKFNNSDSVSLADKHLIIVFFKALEVYKNSGGAFDPTVKPLINFWGFGTSSVRMAENVNKSNIDTIMKYIGFGKVQLQDGNKKIISNYEEYKNAGSEKLYLIKSIPGVQLDFNAIAQGYTVDVIALFLERTGIRNFLVEVGGEVRAKGKNAKGEYWKIGIDKPKEDNQLHNELQAVISLKNRAIATSGNYRKFYIKDGIKYSHTIDPTTGFPVNHKPALLSATVIAPDCMTADAYSTAIMAMGLDNAIKMLERNKYLDAYLVYSDEKGNWQSYSTGGIKEILEEMK